MIILYLLSIANVSQFGLGEYVGGVNPFSPVTNPADMNYRNVHFSVIGMFEYSETGNYGFIIKDGIFSIPFKNLLGIGVSYSEVYDDNYEWVIFSDTLQRDTLTQSISGVGEIGKYNIFLSMRWKKVKLGLSYSRIFGKPMEIWKVDFAQSNDIYDTLTYNMYGNMYNLGISLGDYNRIGVRFTYPDSFNIVKCNDADTSRGALFEKTLIEMRYHINPQIYFDVAYETSHQATMQIYVNRFYLRAGMVDSSLAGGISRYLGGGYTFQLPKKRMIRLGIDVGDVGGNYPDRFIRTEVSYIFNENW